MNRRITTVLRVPEIGALQWPLAEVHAKSPVLASAYRRSDCALLDPERVAQCYFLDVRLVVAG